MRLKSILFINFFVFLMSCNANIFGFYSIKNKNDVLWDLNCNKETIEAHFKLKEIDRKPGKEWGHYWDDLTTLISGTVFKKNYVYLNQNWDGWVLYGKNIAGITLGVEIRHPENNEGRWHSPARVETRNKMNLLCRNNKLVAILEDIEINESVVEKLEDKYGSYKDWTSHHFIFPKVDGKYVAVVQRYGGFKMILYYSPAFVDELEVESKQIETLYNEQISKQETEEANKIR